MSDPAIEVRGVVKRFGGTAVLDGVDLTVEEAEFVAVSGRSGAGKSTLLQLLAAVDRPDAGALRVLDVDLGRLHALNRYRRREIGIVFQLHNLIPRLEAWQNVAIALFDSGLGRRQRRERALEVLDQVGLAHKARSRPPQLSGGERQRVAIARALANGPRVLLADEPTGSLDDDSAEQVLDVLQRRRDAGVTILAVTHDPRLSSRADRIVRLDRGRIVDDG